MCICEKRVKDVPFIHLLFLTAINSTPDRNRLSIYSTCRSLSYLKEKQKTSSSISTRVDITVNKKNSHFRMDSSRSSLPNIDRANSTLFKRYLEEQHKSVIRSNNYQQLSRPINSTIQITHTHRQQQDTYTSKLNNNTNNQQVLVKRKCSKGRKPSADTSKQRTSHTSRFMKRFQRQYKNGETVNNVQKRGLLIKLIILLFFIM